MVVLADEVPGAGGDGCGWVQRGVGAGAVGGPGPLPPHIPPLLPPREDPARQAKVTNVCSSSW
jgi:hypothetical protein